MIKNKTDLSLLSPVSDSDKITIADRYLKLALAHLTAAGCPKSAQRVRLAISSVKGALTNARYRENAAGRGQTRKRIKRAPKIKIRNIDMDARYDYPNDQPEKPTGPFEEGG